MSSSCCGGNCGCGAGCKCGNTCTGCKRGFDMGEVESNNVCMIVGFGAEKVNFEGFGSEMTIGNEGCCCGCNPCQCSACSLN